MSKPMKPKTTGLSAGPTAYWDARSDAAKDAEIERLREENERLQAKVDRLTKRGFEDLNDENERLWGLLKKCQPYVEAGLSSCDTRLCDRVEKEVSNERK